MHITNRCPQTTFAFELCSFSILQRPQNHNIIMTAVPQILFTPGPLMTSDGVRRAMLVDYASRDATFLRAVNDIRGTLLKVANLDRNEWAAILLQGAGTMGIEATISTLTPRTSGKYLLINTGKYSERQRAIVKHLKRDLVEFIVGEGEEIDMAKLEETLKAHPDVTNVGYVFHETSTGMIYPAEAVGELVRRHLPRASIIVDAISGFGGIPFDVPKACDAMIASSNKCFHGVPGFSIVLARRKVVMEKKGNCTSLTLDLQRQLAGFDKNGQFLVTPPVHVLMAFRVALQEFVRDGGVDGRVKQYKEKADIIIEASKAMGFELFLRENRASFGNIVVALKMPKHPLWDFKAFYTFLNERGFVIYPGKASHAETFRFGIIGATTPLHMRAVMSCSREALASMGITNLKDDPVPKSKL
jgi:2-aminoethylphosphonate-pyruvate transaminase